MKYINKSSKKLHFSFLRKKVTFPQKKKKAKKLHFSFVFYLNFWPSIIIYLSFVRKGVELGNLLNNKGTARKRYRVAVD